MYADVGAVAGLRYREQESRHGTNLTGTIGTRQNSDNIALPADFEASLPALSLPFLQGILQAPVSGSVLPSISPSPLAAPVPSSSQQSTPSPSLQTNTSETISHSFTPVAWMPDQTTIFMTSTKPVPTAALLPPSSSRVVSLPVSASSPAQTSSASGPAVQVQVTTQISVSVSLATATIADPTTATAELPSSTVGAFHGGFLDMSSGQKAGFITGVTLGSIAAVLFLVVFCVWLARVRKRGSRFYPFSQSEAEKGGSGSSDMKDFIDGVLHAPSTANRDSSTGNHLIPDRPPRQSDHNGFPAHGPFASSSYPHPRPLPFHSGSADTQTPQALGALKVMNMLPGDASSSFVGSQPASRTTSVATDFMLSHEPPDAQDADEVGTPREEYPGLTPRYLGLDGYGLDVPWRMKLSRSPKDQNTSDAETKSFETLPLPFGPSPSGSAVRQRPSEASGWGTTLRSSFFNAISTVKRVEFWGGMPIGTQFADTVSSPELPERQVNSLETTSSDCLKFNSGLGITNLDAGITDRGKFIEVGGIFTNSIAKPDPAPSGSKDSNPQSCLSSIDYQLPADKTDDNATCATLQKRDFLRRPTDQSISTLESVTSSLELSDRELLVKRVISERRKRRKITSVKRVGHGTSLLRRGGTHVTRKSVKVANPLRKRL